MRLEHLMLVIALGLLPILACLPATAAQEVNISITNTTVYISFREVKIVNFTSVVVYIGYVAPDIVRIVYTCMWMYNYSEECTPLEIYVCNDTQPVYYVNFTDVDYICSTTLGNATMICSGYSDVNVTGFAAIYIDIYNATSGELLDRVEIPRYGFIIPLRGFISYLATLIPAAIIIGLAGRGSLKTVGIGLIMAGIVMRILPYIGIVPSPGYANALFVACIAIGGLILWFSK